MTNTTSTAALPAATKVATNIYRDNRRGSFFYVFKHPDGRQERRRGFTTLRECQKAYRAARGIVDKGGPVVQPTKATTAEVLGAYLVAQSSKWRPETARRAKYYAAAIVEVLGKVQFSAVTVGHVDHLRATLEAKGRSARTVKGTLRLLSACYKRAVRRGEATHDPVALADPVAVESPELRIPTPDEVAAIIAASVGTMHEPIVRLAAATGARRGELCALRWSDIDLDTAEVTISKAAQRQAGRIVDVAPKTKAGVRVVVVPPATLAWLREWRARQREQLFALGVRQTDETHVCGNEVGAAADLDAASRAVARMAEAVGCPGVRLHDLRHFVASQAIEGGADVVSVAAALGHSDPSLTLRVYSHAGSGAAAKVAAVMAEVLGGGL